MREDEVDGALCSLSINGDGWLAPFQEEINQSYPNLRAYVDGAVPNYVAWRDVRVRCITEHGAADGKLDRRLWTWEVRMDTPPDASHFEALVLSHEASKYLEDLQAANNSVPSYVRVIHGRVDEGGVHYFLDEAVLEVLCGPAEA